MCSSCLCAVALLLAGCFEDMHAVTPAPTALTAAPTVFPTIAPTEPTPSPTAIPTARPTARPTASPTYSIWAPFGRGSGACKGPAIGTAPAVTLGPEDNVTLKADYAPEGGCIWVTSTTPIDLRIVSRIEADVHTSGNGSQWFALWLDPFMYVQPPPMAAEIDLIENLGPGSEKRVRTNFAGCADGPDCHEVDWGVPGNAVHHHITATYNVTTSCLEVYHCEYGAPTCPPMSDPPFIQINKFPIGDPIYYIVVDIWQSTPGQQFEFSVSRLRLLQGETEQLYV